MSEHNPAGRPDNPRKKNALKAVDPTKSLAQVIFEQTGRTVPGLMLAVPTHTTARDVYELVERARNMPGLLESSAELRALAMLADTSDLTADGAGPDDPVQIDAQSLRDIAAWLDGPTEHGRPGADDATARALAEIVQRLTAIEASVTPAPGADTLAERQQGAGGVHSAELAAGAVLPYVPKYPAHLSRWRATWAILAPLVDAGATAKKLQAAAGAAGLESSPNVIRRIVRAGEAGLLDPPTS